MSLFSKIFTDGSTEPSEYLTTRSTPISTIAAPTTEASDSPFKSYVKDVLLHGAPIEEEEAEEEWEEESPSIDSYYYEDEKEEEEEEEEEEDTSEDEDEDEDPTPWPRGHRRSPLPRPLAPGLCALRLPNRRATSRSNAS
jgi:hypothetical protein